MKKVNAVTVLKIVATGMVVVGTAISAVITGREGTKEIIENIAKVRGTTK